MRLFYSSLWTVWVQTAFIKHKQLPSLGICEKIIRLHCCAKIQSQELSSAPYPRISCHASENRMTLQNSSFRMRWWLQQKYHRWNWKCRISSPRRPNSGVLGSSKVKFWFAALTSHVHFCSSSFIELEGILWPSFPGEISERQSWQR